MVHYRFPPSNRLRNAADFEQCFAARQRIAGRLFIVHWTHSPDAGPRLGLAVSRKVDRRAVVRNRIKRVVRDAFRRARDRLPPVDLVILPKREAVAATAANQRADLAALFHRLASLPPREGQGTMRPAPAPASPVTSAALAPSVIPSC